MMISWSQQTVQWLAAVGLSSMTLSLVALIAIWFRRRASASVRFTIAQSAMTGVVALAVICAAMPGVVISPLATAPAQPAVAAGGATSMRHGEPTQERAPGSIRTQPAVSTPAAAKGDLRNRPPRNVVTTTNVGSARTTAGAAPVAVLGPLISLAWLAGCLFLLARVAFWVTSAYRSTRQASLETTRDQQRLFAQAMCVMDVPRRRPIRLAVSAKIPVPYTMGVWRPVIVLPAESRGWPEAKTTMVLRHELAHVQRRDVLWCWINHVACSLTWFNPLVWLLGRGCVVQREQACDDRVLCSGAEPTLYGTSLVEIAASLSGRRLPLKGAVAMTEPPLKRRLASVLSSQVQRQSMSRRSLWLVISGFAVAVMILGSLRPLGPAVARAQTQPGAEASEREMNSQGASSNQRVETKGNKVQEQPGPVAMPDSVTGRTEDPHGNPIVDATVRVELIQRVVGQDTRSFFFDVLRRWEVTSDESGQFSVDTSEIEELPSAQFIRVSHATARDFVLARSTWLGGSDIASGKAFQLKMLPARRVIAHVLGSDLRPVSAVVNGAGTPGSVNKSWWMEGETVGRDGMLSIYVPNAMDAELLIYATDHAPHRVKLGVDDSMLGQIVLRKGTRVRGRVLDRKGDPVAGTVVQLRTSDRGELAGLSFAAGLAVKTDETGHFELPPCLGNCSVSVAEVGRDYRVIGQATVKGVAPPVISPVRVTLDGQSTTREVNLKQGPTATIEGVARWANGRAVVGMPITAAAMGADISFGTTDANGRYQLEIPIPLQNATLMAIGQKDAHGVFHMAHKMWEDGHGHPQIISLESLEGDLQNVNWELRIRQGAPKPPPSTDAADRALRELRQQADSAMTAYRETLAKETTFNARNRLRDQLDPRNLMASPYLAMEQDHRGTRAAFEALVELMRAGRSVADPTSAAAQGRIEAVDRLIGHYIKYQELHVTFPSLDGGPTVPRADEFLQAALDKNPHRNVQVAALIAHIAAIKRKLRQVAKISELREQAKTYALSPSGYAIDMQRRLSVLENIDPDQLRAEANDKIRLLATQYANQPLDYYGTAGDAAKRLSHAINNVIIGQAAPEIVAPDINGKPFRLSQHKGKVVMLLFAQDLFDNYAEYYQPVRRFVTQYAGQPLKIVGIMSNDKQEHLKAAARRGDLPWTVIPQPLNGPVQLDWGIDAYPTIYMVDHQGRLRASLLLPYGDLDYDTPRIEAKIEELLSQAPRAD